MNGRITTTLIGQRPAFSNQSNYLPLKAVQGSDPHTQGLRQPTPLNRDMEKRFTEKQWKLGKAKKD